MGRNWPHSCAPARRFRYSRMTTNVAKLDLNQGLEPTPEEVKAEQALLDSLLPIEVGSKLVAKKPKATKQKPKATKAPKRSVTIDGLSQYMKQLSHIPLFTAEQEAEKAKELEGFCLQTWAAILEHPGMLACLIPHSEALETETQERLLKLTGSYKRAAAKSNELSSRKNSKLKLRKLRAILHPLTATFGIDLF